MRQVTYTVLISVAVALLLAIGNTELPAKTKKNRTSTFWVPGSLAKPSSSVPPIDDNISPKGNGAIITGKGPVHIFIPVNTPVVTENTNVYLTYITLVFKSSNGATIRDITEWNVDKKNAVSQYLGLHGDYTSPKPGKSWAGYKIGFNPSISGLHEEDFVPQQGINIELTIDFPTSDTNAPPGLVYLEGIGLEFRRFWD